MILLILLGIGFMIFGLFNLGDAGILRLWRTKRFDALLIDEVEDEVYDNTGNTKIRFFKAYEFEENGEKKVVRSSRPMRRITNKKGNRCVIFVDTKNRKAMDKGDIMLYGTLSAVLMIIGIFIILGVIYIRLNVKGAVL